MAISAHRNGTPASPCQAGKRKRKERKESRRKERKGEVSRDAAIVKYIVSKSPSAILAEPFAAFAFTFFSGEQRENAKNAKFEDAKTAKERRVQCVESISI